MSALSDLGPVMRSKAEMRPIANEAYQLALILIDETGARGDVARANRTLRKLQAIVGPPGSEGGGDDHLEQGSALRLSET